MTCDETFYHRYLNGDDAGLEALMKKYGNPLTLYLDGYLHDVHEAEDLMLDVFAYLFTKKPRIRDGGFKAYLYKTARNMALRHKSKRKCLFRLDELTDESDGQLLVEEVIRTEERNRILHFCMGEMNPDYREVLYLTYFEGMSYAQAAEVTGKTVKQITNMVYRGKENPYNLIAFQSDCYTQVAQLDISPAPDTLLRVFMAWKPLEEKVDIPAQTLTAPARDGFTAVEWGGSRIN